MTCACRHLDRDPFHCIVPPHISRRLSMSPDRRTRAAGLALIAESARLRGFREAVAARTPHSKHADMPAATRSPERFVYDAKNGWQLPGQLVASEGDDPSAMNDRDVRCAYDYLGETLKLFSLYGRNSIDGNGGDLFASVHYLTDFNNAFWNGRQMVFGDGDGRLFTHFVRALDVVAHELAHGVTDTTAGLEYHHQSGALNEHFSDVFGVLAKQRLLNLLPAQSNWLIGEGILGPDIDHGSALRSMKAPGTAYDDDELGTDPQPAHMRDYSNVSYDNGGVHINSGIPNHAFYVAATTLGRPAWEDLGRIWYASLLRLGPTSQFADLVTVSRAVAAELFGQASTQVRAVEAGWDQVGLLPASPLPLPHRHTCPTAPEAETLDQVASVVLTRLRDMLGAGALGPIDARRH